MARDRLPRLVCAGSDDHLRCVEMPQDVAFELLDYYKGVAEGRLDGLVTITPRHRFLLDAANEGLTGLAIEHMKTLVALGPSCPASA